MQIGNAVINDETDTKGMYDFYATHALVSDEVNNQVHKYCDFSPNATKQPEECNVATDDVEKNIYYLDIYNIYAPLCASSNLTAKPKKVSVSLLKDIYVDLKITTNIQFSNISYVVLFMVQIKSFDPCSDYYVHAYLNRPDVQEALHANVTKLTHDWESCR